MMILALTGSIGMGKSTTADFFRAEGVKIFDADRAVHEIYDGAAPKNLAEKFPDCLTDGKIDRQKLGDHVFHHPPSLAELEALIHPLIDKKIDDFCATCARMGEKIALLDVPLLFETGLWRRADAIVVVSAPHHLQRARVLARDKMDEPKLNKILQRQTPDAEKRRRAHFVIDSQHGLDSARRQVRAVLKTLKTFGR